MRHGISGRKFNRKVAHNRALLVNLAKSLIKYEQIATTLPKAKELRPFVEKTITLGKMGGLQKRRQVISLFGADDLVTKIMGPLSERYNSRPGGYTRILHNGFRKGDRTPMAVIELIDRDENAKAAVVQTNNSDTVATEKE
ncbi:MAG: 50S ribosomal protein L17 [Holosporales bacterium]|jgi:large subunit ribosomal protein L17|nr:50S ribosomal protein L17 [Holosporales bacterium]